MSLADKIFIDTCRNILDNGISDENLEVRPKWLDGTPAHTIKKFCIVNRYDLSKEFPIITLRRTAFKSAIDEILWIWQKKSNNVHDLNSHIWDSWRTKQARLAKRTAINSAKRAYIPRANSTKWTECFSTSNTIRNRGASSPTSTTLRICTRCTSTLAPIR